MFDDALYEALKNNKALVKRFWTKVKRDGGSDCWTWTGANSGGYGAFWVAIGNSRGRMLRATAVSLFLSSGARRQNGQVVMHLCDNPPCVNPAHLSFSTQKENVLDMHKKGRAGRHHLFGENCASSRLTAALAHEIRHGFLLGIRPARLSLLYGLDPSTIRFLINGKSWISKETM